MSLCQEVNAEPRRSDLSTTLSLIAPRVKSNLRHNNQVNLITLESGSIIIDYRLRELVYIPKDKQDLSLRMLVGDRDTSIQLGRFDGEIPSSLSVVPRIDSSLIVICRNQRTALYGSSKQEGLTIETPVVQATILKILGIIQAALPTKSSAY
jgi:hypothetical protein